MERLIDLIFFILITSGLTQILVYGKIFESVRPTTGIFGELFRCSLCVGFHVGYVIGFLTKFSGLIEWELQSVDYLILSLISSGTSYVLDKLIGDEGIRISK